MNQGRIQTSEFQTFVGGYDKYVDKNLNTEELINFYPEIIQSGRKGGQFVLRASEGSKTVSDIGMSIRALYACSRGFQGKNNQALVCVANGTVFYAHPDDNADALEWKEIKNKIASSSGIVDIIDNGYQVFICDGKPDSNGIVHGKGYYIDFGLETNSKEPELVEIPNNDMPIYPQHCAVVGPYVCVIGPIREGYVDEQTSSRFYFSNVAGVSDIARIQDGKKGSLWFDGVNFEGSASFNSPIRNIESLGGLLWIFGDSGFEAWQATGNWRQEFQRVSSAFGSGNGLYAEWSLKSNGKQLFWLGTGNRGNAIAYMLMQGSVDSQRISIASIEEEWQSYPDAKAAIGSVYSHRGHIFYLLTFPQTGITYVYDDSTRVWHKRNFYDKSNLLPWSPYYTQTVRAKTYGCSLGINSKSKIYRLAEPHEGDDGEPIYRKRISPCHNTGLMRSAHYELMLDLQSGREYKNREQTIFKLRYSDDGGYSWSADMIQRNGRQGEHAKALQFRRLGQARKRVYELSMVDPIGINIAGARLTTQLSSMRL